MKRYQLILFFLGLSIVGFSQRGKDGDFSVSGTNVILNTYDSLATSVSGGNTISVSNINNLNGAQFSGPIAPGDLIMIYEVQGVYANVNNYMYIAGWGNASTVQDSYFSNGNTRDYIEYGGVYAYYNVGKYEFAEVLSTSGNQISLTCSLKNNYEVDSTSGKNAEVVRVPRFNNLTIPTGSSISGLQWNGTSNGVIALEVSGDLTVNGDINGNDIGFRGGSYENDNNAPAASSASPSQITDTNARGFLGSLDLDQGAQKGEGIAGTFIYTSNVLDSKYCYGAIANGGGGGNYHNAGGGGGSNVGTGTYYGYGVPDPAYATSWNLESSTMVSNPSSGGGRGGYSAASIEIDPTVHGPFDDAWGVDYRRIAGGVGGHPLSYSADRAFMGGGGGAGNGNNNYGTSGGNGGGFVIIRAYGSISGTGTISANGESAASTKQSSSPGFNKANGDDGAGGAGGGGSVIFQNINPVPNSIHLEAKGGDGGDNFVKLYSGAFGSAGWRTDGPGGGGAGGLIAITSGSPSQDVSGGVNGTCNLMAAFPPNGATGGAQGLKNKTTELFDLIAENDTICAGDNATITINKIGSGALTSQYFWTDNYSDGLSARHMLGAGVNTITFNNVLTTKTIYIGACNAPYRVKVSIVVSPPIVINGTPPTIVDESCAGNDGSITGLSATGGTGTLIYSWDNGGGSAIDATGLSANNYTLTVTDDKGCSTTSGPYTISSSGAPTIDASSISITDETCAGNNGSITGITVSGGATPYTYSWDNGGGTNLDASNLTAGNYTLTVTDNSGCTSTSGPHTISTTGGPTIDASSISITDETCAGNDGSITGIAVSGGATPYTYSWSNSGGTNLDASNLTAGNYTLTVTDNSGCSSTSGPHTISTTGGPTIDATSISITDETCAGNDGSITGIAVSGGATPYTYSWSNSGGTNLDASNLTAGNYTLTVTDNNGCTSTSGPHTISTTGGPTIDASSISITDETCAGNDGSITGITVSGGATPYTYSWDNGGGSNLDASNLTAGNYTLTVTDNNGCTSTSGPHTISTTGAPTIDASSISITDETCAGNDGSITGITVSGGATPYTYSWSNGGGSNLDASNLTAGNYTLTVTDNNGCTSTSGPHTISTTGGPTIDATSISITDETCAGNDGSITGITVSGGATPYTYSWSNGGGSNLDASNLTAGNYTLTVTDNNGCSSTSGPHTISTTGAPTIDATSISITDETCAGNDGSITGITVSGGATPYTYSWSNGGGTNLDASNLTAGNYTLTVTDNNGCTSTSGPHTISTTGGPTIDATSISITDETCAGNDGSITGITVSGGATPYTYSWDNGGGSNLDASNLTAGNYTLTVTDNNGCTSTSGPHTISTTGAPTIDATSISITDETCAGNDGSITGITVSGGATPYTYSWSNGGGSNLDASNLTAGNYTLTVTDNNGCASTSGPHTISTTGGPTIDATSISITDETCAGNDGSITGITVSGGATPYTYSWDNGGGSNLDASNLTAGNYTLTVTDNSGCSSTSGPHTVSATPGPTAQITTSDQTINEGESVAINTVTTPTNVNFSWNPPTGLDCVNCGTPNASPSSSTLYIMTVTDPLTGCTASDSILITVKKECKPIVVPTVFSPNNDGLNDVFSVLGGNCIFSMKLQVFDRWGERVFITTDVKGYWDGTYKGKPLNTAAFVYTLDGVKKDGSAFHKSGNINLVR